MKWTYTVMMILITSIVLAGCSNIPFLSGQKTDGEEAKETITEEKPEMEMAEAEPEEMAENEPKEETAAQDENKEKHILGDYNVFLGGEVVEEAEKIIINGESNLIPGSRLVGEALVGDEEEPDFFTDTSEKVQDDGTFYMELNHPQMSNIEEIKVQVKFHFDTQQGDEVVRHYGERGQNLEGPYIYKHQRELGGRSNKDIYEMAKVITTFEPGETMAIRQFKEPKWYELPEDMGDSRVWLEIDEINNDQEFFYLHGRSNLVEGSRLSVEYGANYGKAYVQPDGSFDFKIDYEYKEDTPFVVFFKPYDYQWNLVEEAYGMEGQNLVGNLVETNKYNNKQFVQKEIGLESQEIDVPDNVELNVEGSEVTMLVPDDVLFDFDKYQLKDSSKEILTEISDALDQSFNKEDLEIMITGHTDNVGNDDYNLELSEQRAKEVKTFLEKQLKSGKATFKMEGLGASKPIASNDTEKGQAKNRRVEIMINFK